MRHPNYAIVVCEIAVLPLVFGEWRVAIVFSVLNGIVLFFRIREEERALDSRRALSVH
jgi:methyltransferase